MYILENIAVLKSGKYETTNLRSLFSQILLHTKILRKCEAQPATRSAKDVEMVEISMGVAVRSSTGREERSSQKLATVTNVSSGVSFCVFCWVVEI